METSTKQENSSIVYENFEGSYLDTQGKFS